MKHFEDNLRGGKKDKDISRREFLNILGIGGAAMLCPGIKKAIAQESSSAPSRYEKHGWFYAFEEMQDIYEREYRGERILKNIVRKKDGKWIGSSQEKEFVVPAEFIEKSLLHLRQLIEQRTAKFIFRLDAFHGHFFVPMPAGEKYKKLQGVEEALEFVQDEHAGVLFHNSEHFKANPDSPEEAEIFSRRNVIGWYDGRPLTILPLPQDTKRTAADVPDDSVEIGLDFKFAAHERGQFKIIADGKEIRLDISFDDSRYY